MIENRIRDSNSIVETERWNSGWAARLGAWLNSFIKEFKKTEMEFNPLIDFPRDL